MMDIQEIQKRLPHRFPFLLVDRVISVELGKSLRAIKNVSCNEMHFLGHFPQRMVMPGVLMLEALAQACAILYTESYPEETKNTNALFLFTGIDDAKFKRMVEPGDQLVLDVELLALRHGLLKCRGVATVNGEVACEAILKSMRREVS